MTPLSDALTAAQKRALQAVEKAYVAGSLDGDEVRARLEACGIQDPVDTDYLLNALDVLREWGAAVPAETNGAEPTEQPASEKQLRLIRDLMDKVAANHPTPEGLTKVQASELIGELQKGTYDPQKWQPF